jgi:hypothetical protein
MHLLQVDSITETSALRHEAYVLFYVRQGMFPWFSNLLNEAKETSPQRTSVQHEHDVFGFTGEEATLLMPVTEHQMEVKKPKATLLMGMTSCSGPRSNPTVAQETIGRNLTCMQH